ncbi:MAG: MerR family transcriptional regulator [Anaerolineae bacterium]|nr:MerR family transcriptional regulator [Anaerolineae bacterium]
MERSLLHIGEVAVLLGVTRKTVRHYHKLGLLPEPERSEGGYRLYSADDLLALQRIRQLQSIGFSLQRIKDLLTSEDSDTLLRDTLRAVRQEIDQQITELQERRVRVDSLLESDVTLKTVNRPTSNPPSYQIFEDNLSELLKTLPTEDIERERRLWALLDAFHWPISYREKLAEWLRDMAQHSDRIDNLVTINQRYRAITALSPDDPEVRRLAEDIVQQQLFLKLDEQALPMPSPFLNMFQQMVQQLTDEDNSPAQQRLIDIIRELVATTRKPS